MGAALRHRVAGDDDRPLGLGEHVGGARNRVGVAANARRDPGRLEQIDIGVVFQNVAGQRQEHRAGRRRQRGLHGAVHVDRQILDAMHLGGPFDERPRQRGRSAVSTGSATMYSRSCWPAVTSTGEFAFMAS